MRALLFGAEGGARLLRALLRSGELPESWIPPEPVLEWRERTRLYKSLVDQRRVWVHVPSYPTIVVSGPR